MRINKYIAQCTKYSRRKADELVENGNVSVNGKVITMLGYEIRRRDVVKLGNKVLTPPIRYEYVRFNKPTGYITTKSDEKGRKTIYDVIPPQFKHLKPVGRLDKDSSGLIILTNDGDLINALTHPSIKVPKVYRVAVDGIVEISHLEAFAKGIKIETSVGGEKKLAYCDSEIIEQKKDKTGEATTLEITLYQGINRQIRKMFEHFKFKVVSLKRVRHATVSLEGLKKTECKLMKPKQIKELIEYLEKVKKAG